MDVGEWMDEMLQLPCSSMPATLTSSWILCVLILMSARRRILHEYDVGLVCSVLSLAFSCDRLTFTSSSSSSSSSLSDSCESSVS